MTDDNVVPINAAKIERPLYPSPEAPLDVARKLYAKFRRPAGRTVVCHRGDWQRWDGQQWSEWDAGHLRSTVYKTLGEVDYDRPIREKGITVDYERTPWNPNRNKIANVLEALAAVAHLDARTDAPEWIGDHDADAPASQMISCTNGLLCLADRQLYDHTPALYNHVSVPFGYQSDAPEPRTWIDFLKSVWPDDPASIALLQEWIGYILTGRTDMQKIFLLIGPTRSGKGTIARTITNLIGRGHVTGPTLASLGTNFGLAPLMGKPLAVIADARMGGRDVHTIVERLLSISGEDVLTIDRKFRDPWSGKLPTRIMILSNEIPRFSDASGAVANRLLVSQMRNSFLGREDRTLDARIAAELPGILNWALEGLDRLTSKGRFTVPTASTAATTMLLDLASPVSAFVRECCTRGPGVKVERDRLYSAWKAWCSDSGHDPGSKATFGRNLAAAVPDLGTVNPRINGKPVRHYTHIGVLPASPASLHKSAVQDAETDAPEPASPPPSDVGDAPTDAGKADANRQVRQHDAGDAGISALSSVPETARPKLSCSKWLDAHHADLLAAGHTSAESLELFAAGEAAGYSRQQCRVAVSSHPDFKIMTRAAKNTTWSITGADTGYKPASNWVIDYLDTLPANTQTVDKAHFRQAAGEAGYGWDAARHAIIKCGRVETVPAVGNSRADTIWHITAPDAEESA